jgi:hypothetical protein
VFRGKTEGSIRFCERLRKDSARKIAPEERQHRAADGSSVVAIDDPPNQLTDLPRCRQRKGDGGLISSRFIDFPLRGLPLGATTKGESRKREQDRAEEWP